MNATCICFIKKHLNLYHSTKFLIKYKLSFEDISIPSLCNLDTIILKTNHQSFFKMYAIVLLIVLKAGLLLMYFLCQAALKAQDTRMSLLTGYLLKYRPLGSYLVR